jgi:hypothetical protein
MVPKVLNKKNQLNSKFITMDLETLNINNTLIPYLLCWYDGKIKKSYFITRLEELKDLTKNSSETLDQHVLAMVLDAMKDICKRKYKNYKIYMHNFSRFDGYFLVKHLSNLGYCDPIINKGKIISCKFTLYETNITVTFMDSLLLLPSSLRELSESFQVDNPKSFFPFKIIDINYSGSVPDIKLFDNISSLDYEKYKESYKNKIWNFKEESVKYCNIDCISLFQILDKFNQLIFNKFKLNIVNYPTLPSLAFGLFRTHYLKKDSIHMLSGKLAEDIRSGYTGGAVDMYIPNGTNIHVYDVNSLYPSVMRDKKMPVGTPTYFQGNILKINPNAFGFFFCKIKAPDNLKHPILQTHLKTKNGLRTVAPLGTWEGMYFSEELYNAEKFGYKFEILWGYTFDKAFIFKDYVNDLYNLRLNYPKSDPMNMTAKLLLNSLYGRFGMDDSFSNTKIIPKADYLGFEGKFKENIEDLIELGDNFLIQYKDPQGELNSQLDSGKANQNINIAIASAVTAYARIHMSQFKNNQSLPRLYYTDTDSLYFDGPLPDSFIDPTELGKLKLEGIYDQAVFLAPKVYALKNPSTEIIKIKGLNKDSILKNNITLETLEALLVKNSNIRISQNKWFRHLDQGSMEILYPKYTLKATGNKRDLVYNEDNRLVGSTPFHVSNGELNKA